MIELHNITKRYRTQAGVNTVLDNVSLRFPEGKNLGILGRNGAGKSTLLRIVAGVEAPDFGRVERRGRISWPLGFAGGFNGSLSGEENCRFVARIYGEDLERVTEHAYQFAELGDYFHMPVRTYSSGMKARLAFGLSMAIDFDVYLVDEVTAVGDKRFKEKCKAAFAERSERASIVMVSHSVATIREYCDQCLLLHDGTLYVYEDVEQAIAAHDGLQGQAPHGGKPAAAKKPAAKKAAAKKAAAKKPVAKKPVAAKNAAAKKPVEEAAPAAVVAGGDRPRSSQPAPAREDMH